MSAAPWPPPKRTMDPREIVTGDRWRTPIDGFVYRVQCITPNGCQLRYDHGGMFIGTGWCHDITTGDRLVSRPMWGDQ